MSNASGVPSREARWAGTAARGAKGSLATPSASSTAAPRPATRRHPTHVRGRNGRHRRRVKALALSEVGEGIGGTQPLPYREGAFARGARASPDCQGRRAVGRMSGTSRRRARAVITKTREQGGKTRRGRALGHPFSAFSSTRKWLQQSRRRESVTARQREPLPRGPLFAEGNSPFSCHRLQPAPRGISSPRALLLCPLSC